MFKAMKVVLLLIALCVGASVLAGCSGGGASAKNPEEALVGTWIGSANNHDYELSKLTLSNDKTAIWKGYLGDISPWSIGSYADKPVLMMKNDKWGFVVAGEALTLTREGMEDVVLYREGSADAKRVTEEAAVKEAKSNADKASESDKRICFQNQSEVRSLILSWQSDWELPRDISGDNLKVQRQARDMVTKAFPAGTTGDAALETLKGKGEEISGLVDKQGAEKPYTRGFAICPSDGVITVTGWNSDFSEFALTCSIHGTEE